MEPDRTTPCDERPVDMAQAAQRQAVTVEDYKRLVSAADKMVLAERARCAALVRKFFRWEPHTGDELTALLAAIERGDAVQSK